MTDQQIFRAHCSRIETTGMWIVFCLRCEEEIGTFSSRGLIDAIFATRARGGVLCPRCRRRACAWCGLGLGLQHEPGDQICAFCELDGRTMAEALARIKRHHVRVPGLSSCTYLSGIWTEANGGESGE